VVGPWPEGLQEVDLPIVGDADCASSYSGLDAASMVCAGEDTGLEDSWQGDSGGRCSPVTHVRGTLTRDGTRLGPATAARAGRLVFRLRPSAFRAGTLRLRVRAVDASGRLVTRSAAVRLRR
jgi:hypothetical protein